jgi:hypothetical protein
MALEQGTSTGIALNVTRTRVTVLAFNLTIIALMLPLLSSRVAPADHAAVAHLTTSLALFVGFCLTLLGLFWLLFSQNFDAQGLSRPWPFALGSITTYLALSQTITAFMHEYLAAIRAALEGSQPAVSGSLLNSDRAVALGDVTLLALLAMGARIWVVVTYLAPLLTCLMSPVRGDRRWLLVVYFLALKLPIYWVYARAWHVEYVPADQPVSLVRLFALQFVQPVLRFL